MTIDPKQQYCECGNVWTPGTYHKIIMLLHGKYSWTCPQCGTILTFQLMHHVVKVETKRIPNKESVYKNG